MYTHRMPTRGEELANALSHGAGLIAAIAATPVLIVAAVRSGGAADIVASSIFGASLILLYLASTWYHSVPESSPVRDRLQRFDHSAIYVLIAGTYTPFTLGVLAGAWGWTLFGIVWGAAVIGVSSKIFTGIRAPRLSTAMYVVMGWLVLIAIRPVMATLPTEGLRWLVAGGVFYTGGVGFYAAQRMRYNHLVWHLFVLAGSVCHFFAVLWYAV